MKDTTIAKQIRTGNDAVIIHFYGHGAVNLSKVF